MEEEKDPLTQEMDDIFQDDDEDDVDNGVLDSKYDNIDEEEVDTMLPISKRKF